MRKNGTISGAKRLVWSQAVALDVYRQLHLMVNVYFVRDLQSANWALVDTGLAGSTGKILSGIEELLGAARKPAAIILTHAHFDHVGAVSELARYWDVPVYVHALEVPYVRGQSDYPPPDPTVGGGLMAQMARFYPKNGIDLGDYVRVLPSNGSIPGFPDWRWIHTPGHTAGHISLLRERDRVLIAGDAVVTVKQESAWAVLTQHQTLSRPPAYFTTDWESAARSVEILAALQPSVLATGHGTPMSGRKMLRQLTELARRFDEAMPEYGRYIREPVVADATGVLRTPPPVHDSVAHTVGLAVMGATAAAVVYGLSQRNGRSWETTEARMPHAKDAEGAKVAEV